jgi:hypothetical protein
MSEDLRMAAMDDGITRVNVLNVPRYWHDGAWHPYPKDTKITLLDGLAAMDEMLRLKLSPDARARLEKLGAADAVPDKSA